MAKHEDDRTGVASDMPEWERGAWDTRQSDDPNSGAGRSGGLLAESGRVEAFSDGVLAIAITLLALDLKVPEGKPGDIASGLLHQWPAYVAYLASFFYIGVVWVNHHALFTRISRVDSGLLWRNLALLLPVSVLPFPTATLAHAMQLQGPDVRDVLQDQHVAIILYAAFAISMGATWLLVFAYLDRHRDLLHGNVPTGFFREERRRAIVGMIGPLVAVAVGFALPVGALVIFFLMPIFYALTTEGWTPRRR